MTVVADLSTCELFNKDWLGSLVPVKGTSKGDTIIAIILTFLLVLFIQLLDVCGYHQFSHLLLLARFLLLQTLATSGRSFSLKDFITHPSKKELDSLLKPQLRQVIQQLEIEHEENAKKAKL